MSNPKKKILFVLSQLVQHGSERYLYEVCRALDRDKFQVEVMTRKLFVKRNYYYQKLRDLDIPIHCKLISRRHLRYPIKPLYNRSPLIRRLIHWVHRVVTAIEYRDFFEKFDVIAVVGIETYCDALRPSLDGNNNVVIHHVNHQYQFERDYFSECPQKKIVILDSKQRAELLAGRLSDAEIFEFPLSMRLKEQPVLSIGQPAGVPRIGVVSRLYRDRPNEPMFRCFHALLQTTDVELYYYGGGDAAQYEPLLREMGVLQRVKFMGHQENLAESIQRDGLSIMWLVSMDSSISYGSIEVASLGVPMVFWNLSSMSHEQVLEETEGALHSFSSIDEFAEFNQHLLADRNALFEVGERLRKYVRKRFEIGNHIHSLEAYYQRVAQEQ